MRKEIYKAEKWEDIYKIFRIGIDFVFFLNIFGFWAEAWAYFPSVLVSPSEVLALFWSFMSESELVPSSHERYFHTINLLLHLHCMLIIRWTPAGQLLLCKSIYFINPSRILIDAKIKTIFLWSRFLQGLTPHPTTPPPQLISILSQKFHLNSKNKGNASWRASWGVNSRRSVYFSNAFWEALFCGEQGEGEGCWLKLGTGRLVGLVRPPTGKQTAEKG